LSLVDAVASSGVVEKPYKKGDGPWDVDERVYPIDPCHDKFVSHEELLDWEFPEYMEVFFGGDDLESMLSCCVYSSFNDPNCCRRSA
jgi:hypothetical protein